MASVVASPRSWWFSSKTLGSSKSKKDSHHSLSEKRPKSTNSTKFNSLASALGLKPKKQHLALAIQSPPSVPIISVQPPSFQPSSVKHHSVRRPTNQYANRPPSNSVSSTLRSSLELRTPSDVPRDPLPFRQSLLTLSDPDPFASQGITSPLNSSKPSVKSPIADASTFESTTKRFSAHFVIDSIPPASSQSSVESPLTPSSRQYEFATGSKTSLNRGPHDNISSASLGNRSADVVGGDLHPQSLVGPKSGSSSTSTDTKLPKTRTRRQGDRTPPSREPSLSQMSVAFGPKSPSSPPVSGRPHVVRQLSASRLGKPPTAPPAQTLPPPPPVETASAGDLVSFILPSDSSPSSSLISFTSSLCPDYDDPFLHLFHPHREFKAETYSAIRNLPKVSKQDKVVHQSSSPLLRPDRSLTRNMKKATSHQSFSSKHESVSSVFSPEEALEKHPRKQRSFHQTRRPHSHRNAQPQNAPNFASFGSHMDPHEIASLPRGTPGVTSMSNRKRFFSGTGIRRPSTSQAEHRDSDIRSVLSLPLENERTQSVFFPSSKPKTSTTSSLHDSIRDEVPPQPPASPEYIPQYILSPAEMLQVEASIEAGTDEHLRGRRSRVPSSSTTHSTKYPSDMFSDFSFPSGLQPSSSLRSSVEQPFVYMDSGSGNHTPRRSTSTTRSVERSSLRIRTRPSTSQATFTAPTSPVAGSMYSSPVSMEPSPVSLPPPPRPRAQPPSTYYDKPQRSSIVPYVPLSPPPIRKNTRSSLESAIMRRSIMRKPSFLEIEDDDKDSDQPLEDSFLDLNRESFDTLRSFEPDGPFQPPLIL